MKKFWPLACLYVVSMVIIIPIICDFDALIKNPLMFIPIFVILLFLALLSLSAWISKYLPYQRGDLNISEKPLRKSRVSAYVGGRGPLRIGGIMFRKSLKIECYSKFFVVSALWHCDRLSYSSTDIKKRISCYELETKTSTGKDISILIHGDLYTFFKKQKSIKK